MINPSLVIDQLVARAITNKVALGITDAVEISEDVSNELQAPYVGIFADTTEETDNGSTDGTLINVPMEIKCVIMSSEKKKVKDSFEEAWAIALKVFTLLRGSCTVSGKTIYLFPRKLPVQILRKSADQSVVQVNLFYLDPDME